MGQVGWGVIGCSDIVERRAGEAIRQQGSSRLVAFHSRDLARAEAFATTFGAPTAYDDLDRLLGDERIDAVYIATEVDRHAPLTIAAAEAGKHILVEKPMALTGAECEEMIDAAARHGVRLAVAYYARFFQKAAVIHDLIAGGGLGRVVRATVTQIGYQNPDPADPKYWRVTGRGGGNILADVGSHRIDLLTFWLGPPRRVAGLADRLALPYPAPDTETALVQFAGGAHATVLANANVPRGARPTAGPGNPAGQTSIELYGTAGALFTDPWSDDPVEVVGAPSPPPAVRCARPQNAHGPLIDDFAEAIAGGRAPRFSGQDGAWATAVIDGARQSAASGRFVDIGLKSAAP
ncbi:MAG TPA: Gfo/Idh/MocA family oxidoreductase [Chloroflexota bacterium]|nr:Gfo/Idh/MocA family oxidoreductase [Chloroflexota bacterium]